VEELKALHDSLIDARKRERDAKDQYLFLLDLQRRNTEKLLDLTGRFFSLSFLIALACFILI